MASPLAEAIIAIGVNTAPLHSGLAAVQKYIHQQAHLMTSMLAHVGFGRMIHESAELEGQLALARGTLSGTYDDVSELDRRMQSLRDRALEMGVSTMYSAAETAKAMKELAFLGFDADQVLAALGPTLNLAAAGEISLADAVRIVGEQMRQQNATTRDLENIADILTIATARTSTEAKSLGLAMSYVSGEAKRAGFSFEETAASVGVLADAGQKGTRAGTGLRIVLSQLAKKDMKGEFEKFGAVIKDARGNFLSFAQIIDNLNKGLKSKTTVERQAILTSLFSARGASAVGALLARGGDEVRRLEAIFKQYTAENIKMKAVLAETGGEFEKLYPVMGRTNFRAEVLGFSAAEASASLALLAKSGLSARTASAELGEMMKELDDDFARIPFQDLGVELVNELDEVRPLGDVIRDTGVELAKLPVIARDLTIIELMGGNVKAADAFRRLLKADGEELKRLSNLFDQTKGHANAVREMVEQSLFGAVKMFRASLATAFAELGSKFVMIKGVMGLIRGVAAGFIHLSENARGAIAAVIEIVGGFALLSFVVPRLIGLAAALGSIFTVPFMAAYRSVTTLVFGLTALTRAVVGLALGAVRFLTMGLLNGLVPALQVAWRFVSGFSVMIWQIMSGLVRLVMGFVGVFLGVFAALAKSYTLLFTGLRFLLTGIVSLATGLLTLLRGLALGAVALVQGVMTGIFALANLMMNVALGAVNVLAMGVGVLVGAALMPLIAVLIAVGAGFLGAFQDKGKLGDEMRVTFGQVLDLINEIAAAVLGLAPGADTWKFLKETALDAMKSIRDWIKKNKDSIIDIGKTVMTYFLSVWDATFELMKTGLAAVSKYLNDVSDWISANGPLFVGWGMLIMAIVENLGPVFAKLFGVIFMVPLALVKLGNSFGITFDSIASVVSTVLRHIQFWTNDVGLTFQYVLTWIQMKWQEWSDWLYDMFQDLAGPAEGTWAAISAGWTALVERLRRGSAEIRSYLLANFESIKAGFMAAMNLEDVGAAMEKTFIKSMRKHLTGSPEIKGTIGEAMRKAYDEAVKAANERKAGVDSFEVLALRDQLDDIQRAMNEADEEGRARMQRRADALKELLAKARGPRPKDKKDDEDTSDDFTPFKISRSGILELSHKIQEGLTGAAKEGRDKRMADDVHKAADAVAMLPAKLDDIKGLLNRRAGEAGAEFAA